jgi:copper chaperone
MALKLHVPSLNNPEAAEDLKETILTSEPEAKVEVDVDAKTVTVESTASEATFKQLIVAAGHTVVEDTVP